MEKYKIVNLKPTMALYANIALNTIEKLCDNQTDSISTSKKELAEEVKGWNTERQITVARKLYTNFYFIERLFSDTEFKANKNQTDRVNEEQSIQTLQAKEVMAWLSLLFDIRCYCTHNIHSEPLVSDYNESSIKTLLESLYQEAVNHSKTSVPDKFRDACSLFETCTKESKYERTTKHRDRYRQINNTYFSLTAQVFMICLFLDRDSVNEFLEAIEIAHLPDRSEEARTNFRLLNPGEPYPEELRAPYKQVLYARDIYTYWAARGHRSHLSLATDSVLKEKYFSILEHLKRIPQERLEGDEKVYFFDIREKNKFMEWALEFWETEYKACGAGGEEINWKWARHASVEDKKTVKQKAAERQQQPGKVSERIQPLRRHEKVIWLIPDDENSRLNDRGDENGFPYYFEKDDKGEYSQALFQCIQGKGEGRRIIIGLMSRKTLCSILEAYLTLFPLDKPEANNPDKKKDFFVEITKACINYVADKYPELTGKEEKHIVTRQEIENRITYLQQKYRQQEKETNLHKRIITIADTWNQMITCAARTNPTHALDDKGVTGGKNGYLEIIKYLSFMSPAPITYIQREDEENNSYRKREYEKLQKTREEKASDLITLLKQLGGTKTKNNYYQQINNSLNHGVDKRLSNTLQKKDVASCHTIAELFKQCMEYRTSTLKVYLDKLKSGPFTPELWKPHTEMRWLGLRDARTPQAAQNEEQPPKPLQTGILNVDRHQHTAVGMPSELRELISEKLFTRWFVDAKQPLHQGLYPSPAGNILLIPDFYALQNRSVWESMSGPQKKRLYQIRREDTLLSHFAYYYALKAGLPPHNMELIGKDFQDLSLQMPIVHPENGVLLANISFYYRHYKQNRYKLPAKLTVGLINLLVERRLIERGSEIPHNTLVLTPKNELTDEDKLTHFGERAYETLSKEEQIGKVNEKLVLMGSDNVFIPVKGERKYFITELLNSYTICRKVFINRIFRLENVVIDKCSLQKKDDKKYLSFKELSETLRTYNILNDGEVAKLVQLRNAAFHSDVPSADLLIPDNKKLIKLTKIHPTKEFIDIFGIGVDLIDKCFDSLEKDKMEKYKH